MPPPSGAPSGLARRGGRSGRGRAPSAAPDPQARGGGGEACASAAPAVRDVESGLSLAHHDARDCFPHLMGDVESGLCLAHHDARDCFPHLMDDVESDFGPLWLCLHISAFTPAPSHLHPLSACDCFPHQMGNRGDGGGARAPRLAPARVRQGPRRGATGSPAPGKRGARGGACTTHHGVARGRGAHLHGESRPGERELS